MTGKDTRPLYEPPRARDLSAFSVSGQEPLGVCETGISPVAFWCTDGSKPEQDPAACSPTGYSPERGGCASGAKASQGCTAGSFL